MTVYVGTTPLYDLGMVGEVDLLTRLDGDLVIPQAVIDEITVEPAATNLAHLLEDHDVETDPDLDGERDEARALLGGDPPAVEVALVAGLLAELASEEADAADSDAADDAGADTDDADVGFVSDDPKLRRIADGLGATVTGSFGIVARTTVEDKYFPPSQAKRVIRRMDQYGLVTTGPLREQAIGDVGES